MVEIQQRTSMPLNGEGDDAASPLRRSEVGTSGSAAAPPLPLPPTSPSSRTPASPQNGDVDGEPPEALDEQSAHAREADFMAALVERLRSQHGDDPELRADPIGLCLSGGGTRAAAFHAGVFWALAAEGLLKEVGHICAVSGGGYTVASYVSHLCDLEANEPPSPDGLDRWYQRVVARFVLRMQRNINYLVDTTPDRQWRKPRADLPEERGSSCFPRILDFPIFIGAVFGSMTATPMLLIIHTLWPLVFSIELFHGDMLRRAWCNPTDAPTSSSEVYSWFWNSTLFIAIMAFSSIFLACLIGIGLCPRTAQNHRKYLYSRSVRHILERSAICYSAYVLSIGLILFWQCMYWGYAARNDTAGDWVRYLCNHYINEEAATAHCSDQAVMSGPVWYTVGDVTKYLNGTWVDQNIWAPVDAPSWDAGVPFWGKNPPEITLYGYLLATLGASGVLLLFLGAVIWRGKVVKVLLTIIIPVVYIFIVIAVAKWKTFGPISIQYLLPGIEWSAYSTGIVNLLFWTFTVGAILTLPVYDSVQKLAHMYYRRSLKRAFFVNGRDISFDIIRGSPYCPNILFGACLHDYRKPWEGTNHIDFTISTLFVGCTRTGFYRNPPTASLARLMTIAGAAVDATFFLNADVLAIRLLLAVVALRFGDFLRLMPEGPMSMRFEGRIATRLERQASRIESQLPRTAAAVAEISSRQQHWISRWLQGLMDRLPAACPFLVGHTLIFVGATVGGTNVVGSRSCSIYVWLVYVGLLVYASVAILSFFAYIRPLQWLMRSPMIQQFQMLFMHRYKAAVPPPYLYISDGGLIEPLGIFPLLRRRMRRIVVSDAAEDPELTMRCLRDALAICREERLCSFYDPDDPHRDMEFVLQDFSRLGASGFLHLGIRYEPMADGARTPDGELFCLRMRLLPGDAVPVRALLTEDELLGQPPPPGYAPPAPPDPSAGVFEGPRSAYTGACCPSWECGGFLAGRRFPNYGVGNQFLTPLHFANLCGLGAELSRPLVDKMRGRGA